MQGWKTVLVGAALALIGFLQGVDWASLIPNDPKTEGWIVSGIGGAMVLLRYLTTTPIFKGGQ